MKLSNKILAFITWGIAIFYLSQAIYYYAQEFSDITILIKLITVALQAILGFSIYRNRNNKFTFAVVIIFAVIGRSIPTAIIIALMCIRKFSHKSNWVPKCWFIPAVVSLLFSLIDLIRSVSMFEFFIKYDSMLYPIMAILGYGANLINFLVLGYWFVKCFNIVAKKTINHLDEKLAFYTNLHDQGVLSDIEFETIKDEIERADKK